MKPRLAIITSHPIQYNAPLFRLLHERDNIDLHVFYTWGESSIEEKYDPGFQQAVTWDIPLLNGYSYSFLKNISVAPGSHHFRGIINPTLVQEIISYAPTAILLYGWAFHSHLQVLRKLGKRYPILFRGDSHLLDTKSGLKGLMRRAWLRWVYGHITAALYVGTHNKEYYRNYGLKDEQLIYAPHAIDNKRFADGEGLLKSEALNLREKFGIKPDDVVFLFVGKLEEKKDPLLLLRAFLKRFGAASQCHLVYVGTGVLEEVMRSECTGYPNVHFAGFQNQSIIPAYYFMSDVLVLPSRVNETWGLVINEAMACSRAIIASDKCGAAVDLVHQGKNGYIFKAGDESDLQNCMAKIADHLEELPSFSAYSGKHINSFSLAIVAKTIEAAVNRYQLPR